jgi:hypothetical protein
VVLNGSNHSLFVGDVDIDRSQTADSQINLSIHIGAGQHVDGGAVSGGDGGIRKLNVRQRGLSSGTAENRL